MQSISTFPTNPSSFVAVNGFQNWSLACQFFRDNAIINPLWKICPTAKSQTPDHRQPKKKWNDIFTRCEPESDKEEAEISEKASCANTN